MKAPMPKFPRQNAEGEAVMESNELDLFADEQQESSLNAKQQNPYGPPFPELYRIFNAGR